MPYEIEPDPEEPVVQMKELANRWIFFADPKCHSPLHIDNQGQFKLMPLFWDDRLRSPCAGPGGGAHRLSGVHDVGEGKGQSVGRGGGLGSPQVAGGALQAPRSCDEGGGGGGGPSLLLVCA